jgi:low temperature requirement protein LtrA
MFVAGFSAFTAQIISSAYFAKYQDEVPHIFIFSILVSGFMYWGYLSIIQPRVMHEIEKIRNENGA